MPFFVQIQNIFFMAQLSIKNIYKDKSCKKEKNCLNSCFERHSKSYRSNGHKTELLRAGLAAQPRVFHHPLQERGSAGGNNPCLRGLRAPLGGERSSSHTELTAGPATSMDQPHSSRNLLPGRVCLWKQYRNICLDTAYFSMKHAGQTFPLCYFHAPGQSQMGIDVIFLKYLL